MQTRLRRAAPEMYRLDWMFLPIECGTTSERSTLACSAQVLRECSHDVEAAVARYEKQRLPDAHALYKLDRAAMARVGALGRQWWNLDFLAARVHVILGMALSKLLPRVFKGPSMTRMFGSIIPYRQVGPA